MRDLISDLVEDPSNAEARQEFSEFIPADKIDVLFALLNLPALDTGQVTEMSGGAGGGGGNAMGAGSVSGAAGKSPWGSTLVRRNVPKPPKKKRKKKKKKTQENVDLSIIDEVMALIIEKGIRYERTTRKKS